LISKGNELHTVHLVVRHLEKSLYILFDVILRYCKKDVERATFSSRCVDVQVIVSLSID